MVPAGAAIVGRLDDPDPMVAAEAVTTIGVASRYTEGCAGALLRAAEHDDGRVRRRAAPALAALRRAGRDSNAV